MTKKISIRLPIDVSIESFFEKEGIKYSDYRILARTLDARGAGHGITPHYQMNLEVKESESDEFEAYQEEFFKLDLTKEQLDKRPVIIGSGPAGLFAALRLLEYGIPSIILERGDEATKRMLKISKYWRHGELDTDSNVCFGEGGAGLFSDGKLITRVKSPHIKYVMNKFYSFGAPIEVTFTKDPHLGSNKIRKIISVVSKYLKENGVEIRYRTRVDSLLIDDENKRVRGVKLATGEEIESDHVVMATGHSATDFYLKLSEQKIFMKNKPFAVGVRIEHPRELINKIQYGPFAEGGALGAAKYRLSHHNKESGRGTYSFCMCPGGYILSSGTDLGGIVINGMSNYSCNSLWSNSALVVSVGEKDYQNKISTKNDLKGMTFQREIEESAYLASKEKATGREVPAQKLGDFLKGKISKDLPVSSCPSGVFSHDLSKVLPSFVIEHLQNAISQYDKNMKGYRFKDALLLAPETRTSAPVTIERNGETLASISHEGLYPCGEGAGYAGGITSAAVDGVKVAETIKARYQ